MNSDPLAPLDLAFWNIETAEHPMHLAALGVFTANSPTAGAHAAELLATRAAAVPGLRMRIRDVWLPDVRLPLAFGGATREPVADFEPFDHVRLHAPTADFHEVAGRLMERPLERGRPPWEAHVLPGEDGTTFAVLFKFHHALADGLRALTLAAAVMDPMDLPAPRPRPAEPPRGLLDEVRKLPDLVRGTFSDLGRALDIGASVARTTLDATLGARSSTALTSEASGTRRTAGVLVDLDDVHRIRKTVGGTVNDVLIAVVAGALRRWLDERGDGSEGVAPRALIPVSRRRPRTAYPQGNRLSGYLMKLPVDDPDPLGRLRTVRMAMDRNKDAGPNRGSRRGRPPRRSRTAPRPSARRSACQPGRPPLVRHPRHQRPAPQPRPPPRWLPPRGDLSAGPARPRPVPRRGRLDVPGERPLRPRRRRGGRAGSGTALPGGHPGGPGPAGGV